MSKNILFIIFSIFLSLASGILSAEVPVVINEIMPSNFLTLQDEDYDSSDWIELYNRSDTAVNLSAWRIAASDDFQNAFELPDSAYCFFGVSMQHTSLPLAICL